MSLAQDPERVTRQRARGQRVFVPLAAVGVVLLLVPAEALLVTSREPDAIYLGYWWSPIASVPAWTLTIGSLGLALLLAVAAAAALSALVPQRARRQTAVVVLGALLVLQVAGWSIAAHRSDDATWRLTRRVLLSPARTTTAGASAEAAKGIRLSLSLPDTTSAGIELRGHGSVPAGPWIVQDTEVLNQNTSDEGVDVEVGSLIDPLTGNVIAAWFWGL